jgi:hypothetical protein
VTAGGLVKLRERSEQGAVLSDLTVAINGTLLEYSDVYESYVGIVEDVAPGEDTTLRVSEDPYTWMSSTRMMPYPPRSICIDGDAWDNSVPEARNVIYWTNPDSLWPWKQVAVFDFSDSVAVELATIEVVGEEVSAVSIANSQLSYYEGLQSVVVTVVQVNGGYWSDDWTTWLAGSWRQLPVLREGD